MRGMRSSTLLVTLEIEHHDDFHAMMQGCRRLSNSRPEIDGLDDLLLAPEQHLQDVAIARERRRSRQGYATSADARAFLQMARQPHQADAAGPIASNPIARAYFRAADEDSATRHRARLQVRRKAPRRERDGSARGDDDSPTPIGEVIELLAEAGLMPERPRALLEAADADPRAARSRS